MTQPRESSSFEVVEYRGTSEVVVVRTDDWMEAERAALTPWPHGVSRISIKGTHPTHRWDDQRPRRCEDCGAWDNGSYGSHAPCGFKFTASLMKTLKDAA